MRDSRPSTPGARMDHTVSLKWRRFTKLTDARSTFAKTACIYGQTDSRDCPTRVGKASEGLEALYRSGTGYAIDAAMHASGKLRLRCGCGQGSLRAHRGRPHLARSRHPSAGCRCHIPGHRRSGTISRSKKLRRPHDGLSNFAVHRTGARVARAGR
jgi:hypothetical protein